MEVALNQQIEITPGVRSGKPRIAGTRTMVANVAIMYLRMGQSLEEIADKYSVVVGIGSCSDAIVQNFDILQY